MPPDLSNDETGRSASFTGMSAAVGAMLRTGEAWFKLTLLSLTGCSGPAWPDLDSLSRQMSISGISHLVLQFPNRALLLFRYPVTTGTGHTLKGTP